MPDIFNYLFTGIKKTEFTFATTSQLFSPVNKAWEAELFDILGVSQSIMQEVVAPGTIIGQIDDAVCKELDIKTMPVIAVASHDTGSAIASVPAEGENWAYISSGTWSLMGIESKVPIISTEAMDANFTNEGGVENTFRFLKNIMGLWLLQQSRKAWSKTNEYSYSEMVEMAKAAQPFKAFVNPDCTDFYNPDDMPAAIVNHCMQTNQTADLSHGEIIRTILESLALKYRYTVDQLKQVTGKKIDRIHIIGGGTQNRLLSQFTANATGLEVVAGPVEATVVGNIMMQAFALGKVDSLAEMRQIIRHSFDCEVFIPEQTVEWDEAYQKFLTIV